MMKNNELQESTTDNGKKPTETHEEKNKVGIGSDSWWEEYKTRPFVFSEEADSLAREIRFWLNRGADMKQAQAVVASAMGMVFAENGYLFKIKAEKLY
ncbi:MAG: hypothetical protein RRY29_10885 [Desulfovibrionaceae bacterium]